MSTEHVATRAELEAALEHADREVDRLRAELAARTAEVAALRVVAERASDVIDEVVLLADHISVLGDALAAAVPVPSALPTPTDTG